MLFLRESLYRFDQSKHYIFYDELSNEHKFDGLNCNFIQRPNGFENGHGWGGFLFKLNGLREVVRLAQPQDDDYVVHLDSDTYICDYEPFTTLKGQLTGKKHSQPFASALGDFAHYSGAYLFLRGDIAKQIAGMPDHWFNEVRAELKQYNITENEDVVISYCAKKLGATDVPMPKKYFKGNIYNLTGYLLHFNLIIKEYNGYKITGKWDIPICHTNHTKKY
jgi:hypothetical protein